ncbi:hypothetical protein BDN72DRAFT_851144 [Pluteus cervinus]|uniref:Uncharacterized protein n=1 Tax=Pluteus cervinus TaxID=181527 RepID=A0ACD3A1H6_9AGAR|nr:hypothetical protein BDN72DRAFT_851144 [Pluteus cervinus]
MTETYKSSGERGGWNRCKREKNKQPRGLYWASAVAQTGFASLAPLVAHVVHKPLSTSERVQGSEESLSHTWRSNLEGYEETYPAPPLPLYIFRHS